MKRCSVKPYEGNKKYIFVSYCHKDKKFVFPIIEQLVCDGYRVWYDEGIDPGSEWPEIIASHLNGCAACIAFISENSLNSHNCRREINFALLKKKPFISVVIEPVVMSLGMEMQLSATQSIFKYTLSTEEEFFKKLYDAKFLYDCLGIPNPSVVISKPSDYDKDPLGELFDETDLKRETFSDQWFINASKEEENTPEPQPEPKLEPQPEPKSVPQPEPQPAPQPEKKVDEYKQDEAEIAKPKQEPVKKTTFWLVRVKTNEKIVLKAGETKLGRSESKADYTIVGNSTIGRVHAFIIMKDNTCFIVDNKSKNKTFLNTMELEPEKEYELSDNDAVRLANEKFIFHREVVYL